MHELYNFKNLRPLPKNAFFFTTVSESSTLPLRGISAGRASEFLLDSILSLSSCSCSLTSRRAKTALAFLMVFSVPTRSSIGNGKGVFANKSFISELVLTGMSLTLTILSPIATPCDFDSPQVRITNKLLAVSPKGAFSTVTTFVSWTSKVIALVLDNTLSTGSRTFSVLDSSDGAISVVFPSAATACFSSACSTSAAADFPAGSTALGCSGSGAAFSEASFTPVVTSFCSGNVSFSSAGASCLSSADAC
mmetsp:Transcript_920/g.1279  ORF Transcript_920/g.1279 Transcript_920/m.1279 type:complete len:250 (-) Transcript_920:691-1440(-)